MANANFTCVLDAWNDGKVLYGRMHYYRSGSYYYQDSTFPDPTMNLGGVTYSDSAFGARVRSGISVGDVYTTTFSRTVGGSGNRTVTFSAGSGQRSDFAGSWSKTVYIPESYSPPTGLNVTIAEIYPRGAKFNVSISSYGNPSSASGRYIEAQICTGSSYESTRKYKHGPSSTSAQINVSNTDYTGGELTIVPNTQYYYGGYATNTQLNTSRVVGQFVTTAEAPTVTLNSVTSITATFDYTANADGGYYDKTIEYSVDSGATWQTGATITGGSAASGSFTVSNLLSGAEYVLMVRVSTTSGSTIGTSVSFQTEAIIQRNKCIYGGVSGAVAKQITSLYGGSNSGAQRITKLYGSANGQTKLIHQEFGHLSYN